MNDVAVLIPCHNEEQTIGSVVNGIKSVLPYAAIIVCDNASTDGTAREALSAGAVVISEEMKGKGNAANALLAYADAKCYLFIDGDMTYPALSAPDLIGPVIDGTADMVVGDRLSSTYYTENRRLFHNTGNRLVCFLVRIMFGAGVSDAMSGYRALSRDFIKNCPKFSSEFEMETELSIWALIRQCRILNVPVRYSERPDGSKSKLKTFADGKRILKVIFIEYFRKSRRRDAEKEIALHAAVNGHAEHN